MGIIMLIRIQDRVFAWVNQAEWERDVMVVAVSSNHDPWHYSWECYGCGWLSMSQAEVTRDLAMRVRASDMNRRAKDAGPRTVLVSLFCWMQQSVYRWAFQDVPLST
jgi:hypothetical protein